jgi:hypothetical protein
MDTHSIHNMIILLHATAATIAFFAGSLLIFSPTYISNQWVFNLYLWTLAAMVILLAGAIVVYWAEYSDAERIIFPALLGLGIFMFLNARIAYGLLHAEKGNWKRGYIESIGFTLVSLFEGFIIVSGLNAGMSGWLMAGTAVLGLLAGRWLIGLAKRQAA